MMCASGVGVCFFCEVFLVDILLMKLIISISNECGMSKTAPRPRFQCASHSVGYKSSKSGCKTQIFFGVVVFWGSYWKSPERMRCFTMTPPWNNATFFLHLKMDGWIRGSVRFFGEPFGFLFFWECQQNIKNISRNSLFGFFGRRKTHSSRISNVHGQQRTCVRSRPARRASVNWNQKPSNLLAVTQTKTKCRVCVWLFAPPKKCWSP